ncbi:imm11 family protein [Aliikangiella sp. IMCC44359]|uniref:imm11 family protein n=1 Tax=Aliikangiella sp. IMCC44359 TaxID=3459125 RepID=UPI00403B1107
MDEVNKIYALQVDYDNFKSFIPSDLANKSNACIRCKGEPLNWKKPLSIRVDDDDIGMPEADISLLNIGSFVISDYLYEENFKQFSQSCEFLPLEFNERKLFLVNVINVVDCLDKNNSKFNQYRGVSQIIFNKEKVPSVGFFKIKEDNFTTVFCARDVYNMVKECSLSGIDFEAFMIQ